MTREKWLGPPARLVNTNYYWAVVGQRPGMLQAQGKEIVFRGSGTPDQLRGNPLTPVIENTTLRRRVALPGAPGRAG